MSVRLTLRHDDTRRTLVLEDGAHVLGAGADADAVIALPTISRMHARVEVAGHVVRVVDLGSSNGTRIEGALVSADEPVPWETDQLASFGQVRARWVPLESGDDAPALLLSDAVDEPGMTRGTLSDAPLDAFTGERLAPLLLSLERGASTTAFARQLGEALFAALPLAGVMVRCGDAILFSAGVTEGVAEVSEERGGYTLAVWPRAGQRIPVLAAIGSAGLSMLQLAKPVQGRNEAPPEPIFPPPETLDAAMQKLYRGAARASRGGLNIVIHGESGTGKEVLARAIHRQAADGPFVALNCAALPEDLLEAELFGIERGVATGVEARPGKFELADGGMLFLDEIGDMPASTQAKILRVLQEGEVVRIGASAPRRINVQIVAATNQELGAMVTAGTFRLDLYHRLADWEAMIPPLRERIDDIPNLALFFLERYSRELGRSIRGLSQRGLNALLAHSWPGNVRELEREMKRLAAFADAGQLLTSEDLAPRIAGAEGATRASGSLADRLAREEKRFIEQAMHEEGGNASRAAERLGISRATLYRRFAELGIAPAP